MSRIFCTSKILNRERLIGELLLQEVMVLDWDSQLFWIINMFLSEVFQKLRFNGAVWSSLILRNLIILILSTWSTKLFSRLLVFFPCFTQVKYFEIVYYLLFVHIHWLHSGLLHDASLLQRSLNADLSYVKCNNPPILPHNIDYSDYNVAW